MKGEEKTFESNLTDAECAEKLRTRTSKMCQDLVQDYEKYKGWREQSGKQKWAHFLANETQSFPKKSFGNKSFGNKSYANNSYNSSRGGVSGGETFSLPDKKTGKTIEFTSSMSDDEVAAKLRTSNNSFAKSLAEGYDNDGAFRGSKRAWAHKLANDTPRVFGGGNGGFQKKSYGGGGGGYQKQSSWGNKPAYGGGDGGGFQKKSWGGGGGGFQKKSWGPPKPEAPRVFKDGSEIISCEGQKVFNILKCLH